jgi:cell division protein FtsI (penicillin-binding protein 3)
MVLSLFGFGLLYSIARIQYVHGDKWEQMGDSLYVQYRTAPAIRGSIYSEDGNLLATSVPIYRISLDFAIIKKFHSDSFQRLRPSLAKGLSTTLKNGSITRYDSILRLGYRKRTRYKTITFNASFLQAQKILSMPIFHAGRYQGGLIMEERTIRRKPYGDLMARTIGFINENHVGAGIEASYDKELAGVDGKMLVRKISGGFRPLDEESQIKPENGKDIFTTIDVHLQDIVNESLLEGVSLNGAAFGTAVLLEVNTGKIKAIVNINRTDKGYRERFNHALGTNYEPGSTLKLLSVLATLEEGDYEPQDSIDINYGKLIFSKRDTFEDSGRHNPKYLTYRQVFEKSSNVGIIKTTYATFKDQPAELIRYYDELHLTQPLETGIKGEVVPSILRPDQPSWSGTSLPSISIGYSFTTSPLHMAMLFNAVANDGIMMKPYLVSSIGYLGTAEKSFGPQVLNRRICSDKTIDTLKSFLDGVVENGTAKSLKDLPFKVAGKTGTSKISGGSSGYKKGQYYSSFIGYFPSDKPRYTLLVLVAKPSSGRYYGSSVAVPIFKKIAQKVQANTLFKQVERQNQPEVPVLLSGRWSDIKKTARNLGFDYESGSYSPEELVKLSQDSLTMKVGRINTPIGEMPDMIGLGLRHALYELENQGYKIQFSGYGKIIKQAPKPNTTLRPGQVIYLKLGV